MSGGRACGTGRAAGPPTHRVPLGPLGLGDVVHERGAEEGARRVGHAHAEEVDDDQRRVGPGRVGGQKDQTQQQGHVDEAE